MFQVLSSSCSTEGSLEEGHSGLHTCLLVEHLDRVRAAGPEESGAALEGKHIHLVRVRVARE